MLCDSYVFVFCSIHSLNALKPISLRFIDSHPDTDIVRKLAHAEHAIGECYCD